MVQTNSYFDLSRLSELRLPLMLGMLCLIVWRSPFPHIAKRALSLMMHRALDILDIGAEIRRASLWNCMARGEAIC